MKCYLVHKMDDVEIFALNKMRHSLNIQAFLSILSNLHVAASNYGDILFDLEKTEVKGQTQLIVCAFIHAEPLTTRGTTLCPATI